MLIESKQTYRRRQDGADPSDEWARAEGGGAHLGRHRLHTAQITRVPGVLDENRPDHVDHEYVDALKVVEFTIYKKNLTEPNSSHNLRQGGGIPAAWAVWWR